MVDTCQYVPGHRVSDFDGSPTLGILQRKTRLVNFSHFSHELLAGQDSFILYHLPARSWSPGLRWVYRHINRPGEWVRQ